MEVNMIMTRRVVTVEMDDTLAVAREIFDNTRFHHLLVVDASRLVGVLSDRDLFKALSPYLGTPGETNRDIYTLDRRVHQTMSRNPVTLPPTALVRDAIDIFNSRVISCIPIIDEDVIPVGIVSWRDILRSWKQ
jgi:acetoin utilization protein AcuB